MSKRTVISVPDKPSELTVPRKQAEDELNKQLSKGKEIQQININSEQELKDAKAKKEKWIDFVSEVLIRYFDNDEMKTRFRNAHGQMFMARSPHEQLINFNNDLEAKIIALESIIERLSLIPDNNTAPLIIEKQLQPSSDVFIVHGHNQEMKMQVSSFIKSVGLNPIILHEQANGGKTIIEKLEHNSNVGFAVVLMTPDDMGYPKDEPEKISPRARQNVIVELGYFVGKLTRKNVCVLYAQGVELPTDFLGVIYIPLDAGENWKLLLAREIKNAGLPLDLNKAL